MNPFTSQPQDSVGRMGEVELTRRIAEWLGPVNPLPPEGIGDDCAVYTVEAGRPQLITTDPVIYGLHFDDSVLPEQAGAKLLKRNISDIAAMGGRPLRAVLSLTLPRETGVVWVRRFFEGIRECAVRYDIKVIGGDIARSEGFLGACLALTGDAPAGRALTRTGAGIGDHLLVTGGLGGSLSGGHYKFEPRVREGLWLAGREEVRSMVDLSDGLAKDLPSLLPPGSEADLDWESLPVREEAKRQSETDGRHPWLHAVCDGEDYELLFALDAGKAPEAFLREWKERFSCALTVIGRIMARGEDSDAPPGIRIPPGLPELANLRAYEHFRSN